MIKNTLHYNYDTTFSEMYDLTYDEANTQINRQIKLANMKNHALILTGKGYKDNSFFDAFSSKELSCNFTWIHFCPQEILNFDDEATKERKYYVSVLESVQKA